MINCTWTCWSWRCRGTPGPQLRRSRSVWREPWQLPSPHTPRSSSRRGACSSPRTTATPSRGKGSSPDILNPTDHVKPDVNYLSSFMFLRLCPLQRAVCLWWAPETAEGAGWNKERSRERVRGEGTTKFKFKRNTFYHKIWFEIPLFHVGLGSG